LSVPNNVLIQILSTDSHLREWFAPQLALVATIGSKAYIPEPSSPTSRAMIDTDDQICSLIDEWLNTLANKQRAQFSTLQTSTLLILAKNLHGTPPAHLWRSTGDLVRSALMLGLHRDPEELFGNQPRMPVSEVQARRCLWYTIMELDIAASLSCCMPSLVQTIEYTCQYPTRIDDAGLCTGEALRDMIVDSDMTAMPHTCQQIDLSRSLPLRLRALRLLTKVQPDTNEIDETLRDLEEERLCVTSHSSLRSSALSETLFTTIKVDMCFRRPMISLYTLQLQLMTEEKDIRIQDTARAFVDAAVGVMSHSDTLDPSLTDNESITHNEYWTIFQALHGDDLIRAATGACLASKVLLSYTPNTAATPDQSRLSANVRTSWPRNAVRRMVEEVVKSLIRMTPDLRSILKQTMGLALVIELTRQDGNTESKQGRMRNALQRVFKLCRERYETEKGVDSSMHHGPEPIALHSTPDFGNFLNSQDFSLDPFGLDLGIDPILNINF
jgi:hypothetical protein